ncbi:MAG: AmmeMemoRadiSam system radical SAM enzyme [Phycisphaerales bacterium]|nr:AmmeMemoRadiSam system radical SAM enzyme [Phycisphaerales bacterium]MBT7171108.1 AmmeMemoRadiSam system radical SAM enzyme [Phycisphaerales bacterium]
MKHKAMFQTREGEGTVSCGLCGRRCVIPAGARGFCQVRHNIDGVLYSESWGRLIAASVDPVEKKPFYHVCPGSQSFSVATGGCNFRCGFCQNWRISQHRDGDGLLDVAEVSPAQTVEDALVAGCESISYTYTEPTIFFEWALETMTLARQRGLGNLWVSNGAMTAEARAELAPFLDAINIDLKAFRPKTYRDVCDGELEWVKESIADFAARGVWVELTTLLVPGMNDSDDELRTMAKWIAETLGPKAVWHLSRFHGDYKMADADATPLATMDRAAKIATDEGIAYVYAGNTPTRDAVTRCPGCGEAVIVRSGFALSANHLTGGACHSCSRGIEGVWKFGATV